MQRSTLSSTTDIRNGIARQGWRGQILVVFVLSLATILIAAALAYDGGTLLLRRRDQQNGGDASALAGARFLPGDAATARSAAVRIATENGFTQGVDGASVLVNIPPIDGRFAGNPGFIEVVITVDRPSIFAGAIGRATWAVSTRSVAANQTVTSGGFGVLALDPTACPAFLVTGGGRLELYGNVQVNSSCTTAPTEASSVSGSGTVVSGAGVTCSVVGGYTKGGGVSTTCPFTEGQPSVPDPLAGLPEPSIPTAGDPPVIVYPQPPVQVAGPSLAIPAGCPGSATPSTHEAPRSCHYSGSYAGTAWRLYPGYYPGGFNLETGTFYLEPGIYHVAGGYDLVGGIPVSFRAAGGGVSLISVDPGGTTAGGGVLIFNDHHPTLADGSIILQGGSAAFSLYPLAQGSLWDGMVIFQSAEVSNDVVLAGGASSMQVRGVIYAPTALVQLSGDTSSLTVDQLIAARVQISGSGKVTVAFDDSYLPEMDIAGLVE
jgi:hypothetical protein